MHWLVDAFAAQTIGVDYMDKNIMVDEQPVYLQVRRCGSRVCGCPLVCFALLFVMDLTDCGIRFCGVTAAVVGYGGSGEVQSTHHLLLHASTGEYSAFA